MGARVAQSLEERDRVGRRLERQLQAECAQRLDHGVGDRLRSGPRVDQRSDIAARGRVADPVMVRVVRGGRHLPLRGVEIGGAVPRRERVVPEQQVPEQAVGREVVVGTAREGPTGVTGLRSRASAARSSARLTARRTWMSSKGGCARLSGIMVM